MPLITERSVAINSREPPAYQQIVMNAVTRNAYVSVMSSDRPSVVHNRVHRRRPLIALLPEPIRRYSPVKKGTKQIYSSKIYLFTYPIPRPFYLPQRLCTYTQSILNPIRFFFFITKIHNYAVNRHKKLYIARKACTRSRLDGSTLW